jgi:CubicO group peptidase (beta-lactamase class C family)
MRFGYCLLHKGKWKEQQLVPADYIELCHQPSPYNPHTPFSLQFEHNSDGHMLAVPHDAFCKSGAGGFCLYVVPSLDLVVYKLGGKDNQWDPALTGLPQPEMKHDRDNWQPLANTPFFEGNPGNPQSRILELVSLSCKD